jgi:hypothetical protein
MNQNTKRAGANYALNSNKAATIFLARCARVLLFCAFPFLGLGRLAARRFLLRGRLVRLGLRCNALARFGGGTAFASRANLGGWRRRGPARVLGMRGQDLALGSETLLGPALGSGLNSFGSFLHGRALNPFSRRDGAALDALFDAAFRSFPHAALGSCLGRDCTRSGLNRALSRDDAPVWRHCALRARALGFLFKGRLQAVRSRPLQGCLAALR